MGLVLSYPHSRIKGPSLIRSASEQGRDLVLVSGIGRYCANQISYLPGAEGPVLLDPAREANIVWDQPLCRATRADQRKEMRLPVLLLLCAFALVSGQGFTNPKKPEAVARKEDVKFIKCQACEALAMHALRQVKAAREGLKPGKKVEAWAHHGSMPPRCFLHPVFRTPLFSACCRLSRGEAKYAAASCHMHVA